ncbi:MAG: FAD-binding protein [Aliifodinibius sp.]|nr:FAD-binding protein [Fodinibius sp.]
MNGKKFLLAIVGAFILMLLLSALFNLVIIKDFVQSHLADSIARDKFIMPLIVIAYLILAFFMAYLYPYIEDEDRTDNARGIIGQGLKFGVIMAFLWVLPFNLILHGGFKFPGLALFFDTGWAVVEQGIGGVVIALVYSRKFFKGKELEYTTRETWKNYSDTQISQPMRQYWPDSLAEIIEVVKFAEKHELQVRAVGSGHSWSDVAVTTDFLVLPQKLNKVLPLEESLLKDNVDTSTLFRVESGITLRELNEILESKDLALPNLGGYDGQTIVGVISTSTHGSGIEFGPFDQSVESLELVGEGGKVYRIEPANGITNPSEYKKAHPDRELKQDDDWINSVVMSMGCMGIFYSVILRIVPKFYLKEVRTMSTWSKVKEDLKGGVLKKHDHYELYLSPYKDNGDYPCLITERNRTTDIHNLTKAQKNRNVVSGILASLPYINRILNFIFNLDPKITPEIIKSSLEGQVDDYTDISYNVFLVGKPSRITAYSQEIGFPMKDHAYIKAIDRLLEMVHVNEAIGELYHTASITIRFVKASKAYLSMMHGYDTCMVEIITVKNTQGAFEMMERYENEMYKYSGRPHWGQVHSLTFDIIQKLYPKFDTWLKIYNELNKKGTFASPFTKRVGFSKETVAGVS